MSRAAKESLPCTLWSQGVHAVRVALSSDLPAMPGNLHPVYEGVRLIHTARIRKKTTQATRNDEASVWKKHVAYTILHAICNHSCLYNCEIHICIAALGCRKRRSFSQSSDITSDLAYAYLSTHDGVFQCFSQAASSASSSSSGASKLWIRAIPHSRFC